MPALEEAPAKSADELQVKDTTSLPVTASRPGQLALPPSPLSPEVISDSNSTSPSVPVWTYFYLGSYSIYLFLFLAGETINPRTPITKTLSREDSTATEKRYIYIIES